ncbi:MAG: polyprenyl synthetase family protein [Tannerellaceae bacterium]|jgi:geranylgeranyl pyrophosphate synthase|nr:polyprenyl synthetase family protein [Tannerellaceae bacterium]
MKQLASRSLKEKSMNMQANTVPQPHFERQRLRNRIDRFVSEQSLVPPLSVDDLSGLSNRLIREEYLDPALKGWIMVEINNCVWRETVAAIPYERRILLLPKCLSNSKKCKAEIDELGLLCHRCNNCHIPDLQDKADSLGVMSIVAEGFTSVVGLIENRVVDAVIGVGCLDSLEKAFPLLIDHAIPGLAVPLNTDGCKDTDVDYEYVERLIGMQSDREAYLLDYDYLKSTVRGWFDRENLSALWTSSHDQATAVALDRLSGDGKRWRPYLLASTFLALTGRKDFPEKVQLAAVAIECFHKASLIHDDIQDGDMTRYGKPTVNAVYGDSIAINVGDILLGEGYRLLARCGNIELIRIAAEAHIALCKGQGMELEWSANPKALPMETVLEIFCNKTVPAFDVSLIMGVVCAGDDAELRTALHHYSRAMGIAYQLHDDIEDFDPDAVQPSAVRAALDTQPTTEAAIEQVRQMAEHYHREALNALHEVRNMELKRLLFRVTQRILKR